MNTMTLEEIQNKIEELDAEIEKKQELIKKFKKDEYDNHANHASKIRQAESAIRQLKMEVRLLQIKIDSEDYYED